MRFEQRRRRPDDLRQWLAVVAAVLLIGAGLAWLHRCGVTVCVFRRLTGLPCLTCGSSRAAAVLLSGDLVAAMRLQPLAVLVGLLAGAACVAYAYFLLVCRRVVRIRLGAVERRRVCLLLLALALLNWLYLLRSGV